MRWSEVTEDRDSVQKLYHFTPMKAFASVQEHGLDPSYRTTNQPRPSEHNMVYLAGDAGHAEGYIYYQDVSQGFLLSVPVSALNEALLSPDDVDLMDLIGEDADWRDYSWEQSLKICGQCGYKGVIPPGVVTVEKLVGQNKSDSIMRALVGFDLNAFYGR